jgi:hypothetical protein
LYSSRDISSLPEQENWVKAKRVSKGKTKGKYFFME